MSQSFLENVDLMMVDLKDNFLELCINKYTDFYYDIIGKLPRWLSEAGHSECLEISKDEFKKLFDNFLSEDIKANTVNDPFKKELLSALFKEADTRNYSVFLDFAYRLLTYSNACQQITSLQNILYELEGLLTCIDNMAEEFNFLTVLPKNHEFSNDQIRHINCMGTIPFRSLINLFFIEYASVLDYLAKIKAYFLKNYTQPMTKTPSVNGIYWTNQNGGKALFDKGNIIIKKARSIRSLIVHEGSFYSSIDIYENILKDGSSVAGIKFPDFDKSGELESENKRHLFYSQNNSALKIIHESFDELVKLLPLTIKEILEKDNAK